ncbi:MAG: hypothetical protein EAZ60_20300 [Oscillatoriales cyanobacterium]|nr:MAG: hypothetical protein EAZ60_20300 [Oscillatoriales cyanobacterium]
MRQSQRNRVFAQIYASQARIIEKTRFLATRASVSGFLPESTHHNQEFSKKPGFWPPARQSQRNRVFARIYAS